MKKFSRKTSTPAPVACPKIFKSKDFQVVGLDDLPSREDEKEISNCWHKEGNVIDSLSTIEVAVAVALFVTSRW